MPYSFFCFPSLARTPSYPCLLAEQFPTLQELWGTVLHCSFLCVPIMPCLDLHLRDYDDAMQLLIPCLSPSLNCESQRAVTLRFIFVALVPGGVVVHSRHLINVSCIKMIRSSCNLSKPCQCPQLRIIFLCPRGCWEDQCDTITKAWERRAASEYKILFLVVYCFLRDLGTLHLARSWTKELESCDQNAKVDKKVRLANAENIS